MKRLLSVISVLIATALPVALSAAIPQRWTVETSRVQPAQFEGFHGETIEFAATMQSYGKPLAITNDLIGIYWQTNGMGSAYWTYPAVLSNNVMIARWTPEMDVGANVYSCFIGVPGEIYRAAFQLRLRPSPGATPSELPLPVKTIDFAQVQVLNAPYYSKSETDAALSDKQDTISDLASIRSGAALGATAVQPAALAAETARAQGVESGKLDRNDVVTTSTATREGQAADALDVRGELDAIEGTLATLHGAIEDEVTRATAAESGKLDKSAVVDPTGTAAAADKAADALATKNALSAKANSASPSFWDSINLDDGDGYLNIHSDHIYFSADGKVDYLYFPDHDSSDTNILAESSFDILATRAWTDYHYLQKSSISETNPTFANAVLAVGLNIDTNSVAVLNEIASTFGGFPIEGTATTVGGLLLALAAAVAWIKQHALRKGLTDGVPDDENVSALFTSANSSLMGVVRYKFGTAITADATLTDRTGNLVIVTSTDIDLDLPTAHTDGTMRDLLIRIEMGASATGTPTINLPPKWEGDVIQAFAAGKNYLLALTETKAAAGTTPAAWYVRVIELAAQTPNA